MSRKIIKSMTPEEILEDISKELPLLDYDPAEVDCIDAPRAEEYWMKVRDKIVDDGFYQSDDDLSWMARNLHRLLNMSLSLKQMSVPTDTCLKCRRMIRIRTFIPSYVYDENNIEKIVLNGMYAPVEGLMLTNYQSDQLKNCKAITSDFIESLGLPTKGYMYGRFKDATNGCIFVLKKTPLTSYITHSTKWEYFNLIVGVESLMIS